MLQLHREKYVALNVGHFNERLRMTHGIELSYIWVKLALQGAGIRNKWSARGFTVLPAAGAD